MKWIGQHIWDFISRFRSTVYIENLETSSEENVLVVDSDGKVTKNTTLGGSDVTMTNGVDNRVMTATGAAAITGESGFTYDASTFLMTLSSSTSASPSIYISNTNTDASSGKFIFSKAATGADDDDIGVIGFNSQDDGGGATSFAQIVGEIADASNNDEGGRVKIEVLTNSSEMREAFTATGLGTGSRVDIGLGYSADSTTTIAGTLTMGSTASMTNAGELSVAAQPNITTMTGFLGGTANALITDDGDGTVTSESNFTYTGTALAVQAVTSTFSHGTASNLIVTNTGDNDSGGILLLRNERNSGSSANQDGDILGMIQFEGHNDAGTPVDKTYALIKATAPDVSSGAEEGQLSLQVASHDGEMQPGVKLFSGDAEDEVDVTIGNGATSVTTIAGTLESTGRVTIKNNDYLYFNDNDNSHATRVISSTASSNRTITLPDATGTVALTSQIVSDGWHGSTTRIKILHSDFIADDGGRPVMIDDAAVGAEKLFLKTNSTNPAYVTIAIPTGFDATHVMIYGIGGAAVEVWEHSITDKQGVSKGTGNVGAEINITDVTSSTTNYLFIQVAQGASDEIYGGYVTIAAT